MSSTAVDEPLRPDYDGVWVGALVPALLGGELSPWLPEAAATARSVVLLVLDGLGWSAIERQREALPTLAGMEGGPITAVAPSTTAAALTSISTGLAPAQHGMVGYRIRVSGVVLNVLRWKAAEGSAPDPVRVQPVPPFLGRKVPVVTRADFRDSGFTAVHLRGGEFVGWQTIAILVEHVRRLVAAGQRFVYAYYDGVDKVAHAYGLANGFMAAELAEIDRLVGVLLDRLPGDCALLVTADHGQVAAGKGDFLGLGGIHQLIAAYSGEARFRSLHAVSGATGELLAAAREQFSDVAWVFSRDELFDDGWLGDGATAEIRHRMGDVVLAARAGVAFADPTAPHESRLVAHHGSLTRDEMLVPLLAARGRG
ncbi:MAG: alkaline phosphatase family protein [Egibacteraceae bacterium]